jgi:hypothetical protein
MERASFLIKGEGRIENKISISNPTASAYLVHFLSAQSHIGEAFGFEVTLLFGCRPRSKRAGRGKVQKF